MRKKPLILTLVIAMALVCVSALTIRIFFLRFVRVPTGSMMNTIIPGDHLIVTKAIGKIARGQIVVFQYPEDPTYIIGRVVGLPGETIHVQGKVVYINQRVLAEEKVTAKDPEIPSYQPLQELSTEGQGPYRVFFLERVLDGDRSLGSSFSTAEPFRIPDDFYFIMGDNRDDSEDSRYRGPVPANLIWGHASLIYYSESMDTLETRWDRTGKRVE